MNSIHCLLCRGSSSTTSLGELCQLQPDKRSLEQHVHSKKSSPGSKRERSKSVWCHVNCAELSPLNEKKGVAFEVKRGEGLSCIVCKKRGATVGCTLSDCERSYHIQCAANVGAKFDVVRHVLGEGGLFCEKHISHPDAASALPAGPGCNASTWADESRNCRKGRDRASELENANDTTVLADELIKKRRKMMDLAMSINGAMGKRCGVCNCGFRVVEGRFSHGPPAANARHTNPLSRDPAHLASSLFLNEESVANLAIWHPLAGGLGRMDLSDRSSAPAGFGPDLKDENDEMSDDDDDENEAENSEEEEDRKRRKLEKRRRAILRAANIASEDSSSLLSSALDSHQGALSPQLNFDEEYSGADVLGVNSTASGDVIPSLYLQGRWSEEPIRQLRKRAFIEPSLLSNVRPIKEACASPEEAGRADDGSWWLAGAPLSCTDCGILVHAACYGISFSVTEQLLLSYLSSSTVAASGEGNEGAGEGVLSWACDSCRFVEKEKQSSPTVKCILCPVSTTSTSRDTSKLESPGGDKASPSPSSTAPLPLKRCTVIKAVPNNNKLAFPHVSLKPSIKGKWVHMCCALWHNEETSHKSIMAEGDEEMDGGAIITGGKKGDKQHSLLTDASSRVSVSIGDLSKLTGIIVTVSDPVSSDGISDTSSSVLTSSSSLSSISDSFAQLTVISKFPCIVCQSTVGATIPLAVRGTGRGSDSRSYVHASCAVQSKWHTELWAPLPPSPIITSSTKRRSEKNVSSKTDVELSLSFPLSFSVPSSTIIRDGGIVIFHPTTSPVAAFCICREPDDGSLMVECDVCRNWFHARCVGINPKRVKKNDDDEEEDEDGQMLGELEDAFACAACFSKGGVPDKAIIAANLLNAEMANLPPRPFSANQLIPPSIIFGNETGDLDNNSDLDDGDNSDTLNVLEIDEDEFGDKVSKSSSTKRKPKTSSGKAKIDPAIKSSSNKTGFSSSSSDALAKFQVRGGNSKGNDLLTFLTPFNLYHLRTWGKACDTLLNKARDASGASLSSPHNRPTAHSALSLLVGFHSIYAPFSIASRSRSSTIAYLLQIASSTTTKSQETEIVLERLFKILMQTSLYDNLLAIGTRVRHTREFCYGYIDNLITVMVEEKGHDTHEICQYMVRFDGDKEARQTRCDLVERVKEDSLAETDSSNSAQHRSQLNLLMQRNAYYFPPSTVDGCRAITSEGVRFLLEELENCTSFARALVIALPQSPVVGGLLPLELLLSAHANFLSIASKALDSAEEHIISISLRNAGVIDESVLYTVSDAKGYQAALNLVDAILMKEKKLPLSAPSTLMARVLSLKALIKWLIAVESLTPLKGASKGTIESSQDLGEESMDAFDEESKTHSTAMLNSSLLDTSKAVASFNAATETEISEWSNWHNSQAGDLHQILALFAEATRPGLIRSALCDLAMRYGVSVDGGLVEVDDSREYQGFIDVEEGAVSDDIELINVSTFLCNNGGEIFYNAKKVLGRHRVWPPGSLTFKRLYVDKRPTLSTSLTSSSSSSATGKSHHKKVRSTDETLEIIPDDEVSGSTSIASPVDVNGRRLTSRRAAMEASAAEKAIKKASSSSFPSTKQENSHLYAPLPGLGLASRDWSFFTLPIGGGKSELIPTRSKCVSNVISNLHQHPVRSVSLLCRFARAANSWLKSAKRLVPNFISNISNTHDLDLDLEDNGDDHVGDEGEYEEEDGVNNGEDQLTRQLTMSGKKSSASSHFFPSPTVAPVSVSMLLRLIKVARAWKFTSPRLVIAEGLLTASKKWDINARLAISRAEASSTSSSMIPVAELMSLCSHGKRLPVLLDVKKRAFDIADRLSWHERASNAVACAKSGGDHRPKLKIIKALLLQAEQFKSSKDAEHFNDEIVSQLKQLEIIECIPANESLPKHLLAEVVESVETFLEASGGSEARIQESSSSLNATLLSTINLIETHSKQESILISQRLTMLQMLPIVTAEEEIALERLKTLEWVNNVTMGRLKVSLIEPNHSGQDSFLNILSAGLGSTEAIQQESLQEALSVFQPRKHQKERSFIQSLSFIPEVYKKANKILGSSEPMDAIKTALTLLIHNGLEDEDISITDEDELHLEEQQTQRSVSLQFENSLSTSSPPIIATIAAVILSRFLSMALAWRKSACLLRRRSLLATTSATSARFLKPAEVFLCRSVLQNVLNSIIPAPHTAIHSFFDGLCAKLDGLQRSVSGLVQRSEPLGAEEILSKDLFSLIEKDGSFLCTKISSDFSSAGFYPTQELVSFQKGLTPVLALAEAAKNLEHLLCQEDSPDEGLNIVELSDRARQVTQHRTSITSLLSGTGRTFDSSFWISLVITLEKYAKTLCVSSPLFTTYVHVLCEEKNNTLSQNEFFSSLCSEESIWNISSKTLLSALKLATLRGGEEGGEEKDDKGTSNLSTFSSIHVSAKVVQYVVKTYSAICNEVETKIVGVNEFGGLNVKNDVFISLNNQRRAYVEKLLGQTESCELDQALKHALDLSSSSSLATLLSKIQEASRFPIQSQYLVPAIAVLADMVLSKRAKELALQLGAALKSGDSSKDTEVLETDEKQEMTTKLDLVSLEDAEKSCATLISFGKNSRIEEDFDPTSYVASTALQSAHADLKTALNDISAWKLEAELLLSSNGVLTPTSTSTPEKLLQSPLIKVISIPLAARLGAAHRETLQWTQRAEKVIPLAVSAISAAMKAVLPASLRQQQNSSSANKGQSVIHSSNSDATFLASLSAEQRLRGVSKELAILSLQAKKYAAVFSEFISDSESRNDSITGVASVDQISSFSRGSLWWLSATASVGNIHTDNNVTEEGSISIDAAPASSSTTVQSRRFTFLQLPPNSALLDSIILTLRQSDGVLNLRHALGLSAPEEIQSSATASYFLSLRESLRPRVTLTCLHELISKMQSLGFGGADGHLIQSALSAINAANSFASRAFTGLSGTDEPALTLLSTYLANHANPGQESQSSLAVSSSASLSGPVSQPLSQTLYAPQVTCDNVIDFLEAQVVYYDHKASKTGPWSYLSIAGIDNAVDEFDKSTGRGRSTAIDSSHPSRDSIPKATFAESISSAADPNSEALVLSRIARRKRIKWAKIRGFPFWPASLVPSSTILSMSPPLGGEAVLKQKQTKPNNFVMVRFFGSHPALSAEFLLASTGMAPSTIGGSTRFAWVRRTLVRPWGRGPNSQDCPNLQPIFVPSFCEAVRQAVYAIEDNFGESSGVSIPVLVQPPPLILEHDDLKHEKILYKQSSTESTTIVPSEPKLSDFAHLPASIRVMAFVKAKAVYSKRGSSVMPTNSSTLVTAIAQQNQLSKQSQLQADVISSDNFLPMSLCLGMAPAASTMEFVTKIRSQVEEEIRKALFNTLRGATVPTIESLMNSSGPAHSYAVVRATQASVQWATDLICRRSMEIEASLFARYLFGSEAVKQQEYGQKFRDIVAVLRLSEVKDNVPTGSSTFRRKVIAGTIRPFQLARMSAAELAAELKICASIDKKDAENEKQKSNSSSGAARFTATSVSAPGSIPPGQSATVSSSAGVESINPKSTTSLLFKAAGITKPSSFPQNSLNPANVASGVVTDNIPVRSLYKRADIPSEDLDEIEPTAKKQKIVNESTLITSSTPLLTTSSLSEYLAQARAKAATIESDNDGSDIDKEADKEPSQRITERGAHFDVRMPTTSYTFNASFNAPTTAPSTSNKQQVDDNSDQLALDIRRQKRSLPQLASSLPTSSIALTSLPVVPSKKPRIEGSDLKASRELTPIAGVEHIFEISGLYKSTAPNSEGKLEGITVTAVRCSFVAGKGEAGWTERLRECPPNILMQQAPPLIFSPAKLVGRMQVDASEKGFLSHLSSIDVVQSKIDSPEKRAMCAFKISCNSESFREFLQSLAADNRVGVVRLDKERDDLSKCYLYVIPPLSFFTTTPIDLVQAMNGLGKAGFLGNQLGVRNEQQSESAFAVLEYRPDTYPSMFIQKKGEKIVAANREPHQIPSLHQTTTAQATIPPQTETIPPAQNQIQAVTQQVQGSVVSAEVASAIAQVNRLPTPYMDASTLHFFNEAVSKCREPTAPISAVKVMQSQMKGNPSHMVNYSFLLPESPLYAYFLARVGGGGYFLDEIGIKALSGAPIPLNANSFASTVAPNSTTVQQPIVPVFNNVNIQSLLQRATKPNVIQTAATHAQQSSALPLPPVQSLGSGGHVVADSTHSAPLSPAPPVNQPAPVFQQGLLPPGTGSGRGEVRTRPAWMSK